VSFIGRTSEDVQAGLADGSFGMANDTGEFFNGVVDLAESCKIGLGEAAGRYINSSNALYKDYSLFAAANQLGLPATVHLVVGADIVHQQPGFKAGPAADQYRFGSGFAGGISQSADCFTKSAQRQAKYHHGQFRYDISLSADDECCQPPDRQRRPRL